MKLKYNGNVRKGIVRFANGASLEVFRGQIYEIEDSIAETLPSSMWEKVGNTKTKKEDKKIEKKEEVKVEEEPVIEEDDTEKINEGGDKKW